MLRGPGAPKGTVPWNRKSWDEKSYDSKHEWVNKNFQDPCKCEDCGSSGPLEWASIGHTYTQNRADWKRLCKSCHQRLDGVSARKAEAVRKSWKHRSRTMSDEQRYKISAGLRRHHAHSSK